MSWNATNIGQIVDAGEADIQTGPFGTQLKASEYVEFGTPVINVRNVGYGDLRPEKLEYLPEEKVDRLRVHVLEEQDIVFGRKGAVDRHLFVQTDQIGWVQGSDCIRLRFKSNKVLPRFVSFAFRQKRHQEWMLAQCGNKATMASLNQDVIKRISLRLPPTKIQEGIVAALSAYDDLIENNRRRIALLEEAARLLYREWFVHFRFPGHEHVKIVDGLPEGWEIKKVGDLLARVKAKQKIRKDEYLEEGEFPCVDQGQNFIGGYTDNSEAIYRNELPLIIFGDHTRILKFVNFPFARGADGTQVCQSNDQRLSQEMFYWALVNVDLSNYFYARHFKFLKDQEIVIPNQSIADDFTRFVKDGFKQIMVLRQQSAELAKARDLLLPRLMDGRLEV